MEMRVSCQHFLRAACTKPVGDAKGMNESFLILKVVRVSENGNALFIKSWECNQRVEQLVASQD